jgi:hypothetical protein
MARGTAGPVVEEDGDSLSDEARAHWDKLDSESPLTPEATPEPPVSTPEAPTVADTASRGDGRDEKGRFTRKGDPETPAPPQDPSAKAPEGEVPKVDPPTPETPANATHEKPPGEGTSPEASQGYSVRYGGRDYEVPGAVRTATHTTIPNDQIDTVTRYIGMGLKLENERGTLQREKAELSVRREMFQAETGPVMEEVKNLFALTADPNDEAFAEKWLQYGLELRAQMPLLKERMELAKQRQEFEIQKRANLPDPETRAQQLNQNATEAATGHLQAFQRHPEFKALIQADWDAVETRVKRDPTAFLRRAGQRLTPEEQQAGVEPGEVYFDIDRLVGVVEERLSVRNEVLLAEQRAKQEIKIATENASRMQREVIPPPPAPQPTGSTVTQPAKGAQTFKNKEEWDRAMGLYDD